MPESKPSAAPAAAGDTMPQETHATPSSAGPRGAADPVALLRPPESAGELGRLGGFRVVGLLGKGGMGAVFAAEDPLLNRPVALKVMRPELLTQPDARERFLREARAAAAIEHDNIVPVWQVGDDNGSLFLTMPLLKGESLQARLSPAKALSVGAALQVAREVAAGLAAAHAAGLIHRDVKPGNLWLDAGDGPHGFRKVRVLDFGLARLGSDDAHLTGNAIVGTPAYMAPEQARGKPVDARTDLFSLGGVLYRCLTGRQPFLGSNAYEVLAALIADEPPPVRELNPDVPEPLAALVHQLLAKSADARPRSAEEVLARLRATAQEPTAPRVVYVPVQTASVPEANPFADIDVPDTEQMADDSAEFEGPPAEAPRRPRRWGVAVAALLVAALAVVAGVIVVKVKGPDGKETEVRVPEGSKVDVDAKGNVTVSLPRGLPVAPMPREADPPELEFRLKAGESVVLSLAIMPGGERIVAGYEDGHLRVWNLATRQMEREYLIGEAVAALSLHPDGKSVAVGTSDTQRHEWGRLSLWDLDTGNLIRRYTAFPIALPVLYSIGFADGGKQIVAPVPRLGLLLSWDTETGVYRFAGEFEPGAYAFLCVHPRGDAVFVGSDGHSPRLVALASGETVWQAFHAMGMTIPGTSADGQRVAFSSWGGMIAVCSRDRPQPTAVFHGPSDGYWHIAVSPDGRLLAAARTEVCVWSMSGGQTPVRVWRDRVGERAHRVAFTADSERLVSASDNGTICVYRVSKEWSEPRKPYPPLDPAWLARVHKLPADEQVKEVSAELVRRNPGFDGKFATAQDGGRIHHIHITTNEVEDVTPVRGFSHLSIFGATGNKQRGKLWDLSPLAGLKLKQIDIGSNPAHDLSPLRDMPLEEFLAGSTLVSDLSPLKGMKLSNIAVNMTPVRDLTPLAGMPLQAAWLHYTRVRDVTPLKSTPLKGATLPATALAEGSGLSDLPFESVEVFTFEPDAKHNPEYLRTLRAMKSLKHIDGKPVEQFWKEIDATPPAKK
jgi:WD40 repeat protein